MNDVHFQFLYHILYKMLLRADQEHYSFPKIPSVTSHLNKLVDHLFCILKTSKLNTVYHQSKKSQVTECRYMTWNRAVWLNQASWCVRSISYWEMHSTVKQRNNITPHTILYPNYCKELKPGITSSIIEKKKKRIISIVKKKQMISMWK